jgi:tRNA nucleotidyltransferase (CCA-adding enzyme)
VARRAHAYPQVMPTAADLVDGTLLAAPPALSATDAARLGRRRGVEVLAAGDGCWVLREDAARADALGVGTLPIRRLARPLPVVTPRDSEIVVRRHLAGGAPAVIVARGRAPLGVVRRAPAPVVISMQARFERSLDAESRDLLGLVGRLAADHGGRAFAVGGLVRDAWLGRDAAHHDLDVVVEGDARLVARALADARGGTLVEHERFLTASVALPGGRRVDVVTARSERYEEPGALPRVMPAAIAQDLRRRDFAANAMAVELASGTFGLLDPLGGAADVARRRLRVLHPLSFVEDPTRILRAARYAARLDFALDPWSARARALALELVPYAALSAARIVAELERTLAEATAAGALVGLARAGAFRLLAPRHRAGRATLARLGALPDTLAWARVHAVAAPPLEVLAVALTADQPDDVAVATLRGLGLKGGPLSRVRDALATMPAVQERLASARRPSEEALVVREAGATTMAWLHLAGDAASRARLERVLAAEPTARPALGGDAVLELGVTRGPDVAAVLGALRDARVDGEIHDRQGEIDYVKAWLAKRTTDRKGLTPLSDSFQEG